MCSPATDHQSVIIAAVDDTAEVLRSLMSLMLLSRDMRSPGGCVKSRYVRCWQRSVTYVMLSCCRSNNSSTNEWFLYIDNIQTLHTILWKQVHTVDIIYSIINPRWPQGFIVTCLDLNPSDFKRLAHYGFPCSNNSIKFEAKVNRTRRHSQSLNHTIFAVNYPKANAYTKFEHFGSLVFTCVSYAEARNRYRLDVCLSVRHTLAPYQNGWIYCHAFFNTR